MKKIKKLKRIILIVMFIYRNQDLLLPHVEEFDDWISDKIPLKKISSF